MNERVAQAGNQLKEAVGKLIEAWKNQEAKRKKLIIAVALGVLALVVIVVIVINAAGGRYVVLYEGQLSGDEVTSAALALQTADIPFTRDQAGQLMVPARLENKAIMQLSSAGIPSSKLMYETFAQGSGLLTSETERSQYALFQTQDDLAMIIRSGEGIKNALVMINLPNNSGRAWDVSAGQGSASVKVETNPGVVLSTSQIEGIRYFVSSAIGIDKNDVTIISGNNTILAAGDETLSGGGELATVKERLNLEEYIADELKAKANEFLSLLYPEGDQYVIVPYVTVDYDQVVRELKEYTPLDDTIHGVTVYEEIQALLGSGQYAGGVAGEDSNTDVPTQADLDGDGELDAVDFARVREYLVSYELTQTTKDGPTLVESGISVLINDTITTNRQITLRDSISYATGIPAERVYVGAESRNIIDDDTPGTTPADTLIPGIPDILLFSAIAAVVFLLLVLVAIILLRARAKKKRLAEEQAAAMAALEEQERVQMEIEQRKLELKNAALSESSEDAIVNEVRDFARSNPDITANLLRNWLKESDG